LILNTHITPIKKPPSQRTTEIIAVPPSFQVSLALVSKITVRTGWD